MTKGEQSKPPQASVVVIDHDVSGSSDDDDDNSSTSSSNSNSSGYENVDADAIRQNARELLQTSPTKSGIKHDATSKASAAINTCISSYQSYQDASPVRSSSASTQHFNCNTTIPQRRGLSSSSQISDEGSLSMADVASMAFACVSTCLTETYRAASTYYYQPDGVSSNHNYAHVAVGHHDNGGSESSYGNIDNAISQRTNYSDGYQTQTESSLSKQCKEVMDRGQSDTSNVQTASQPSGEKQIEEWGTSLQVPSTYQGGGMGSR